MLRTRAPVASVQPKSDLLPLDLHVLSLPPAFILSQDQTLRSKKLDPEPLLELFNISKNFLFSLFKLGLQRKYLFLNPQWILLKILIFFFQPLYSTNFLSELSKLGLQRKYLFLNPQWILLKILIFFFNPSIQQIFFQNSQNWDCKENIFF